MLRKASLLITVLCIFLIVTFSSVFSLIYNLSYYDSSYEKHDVYDRFTRETALNATKNLYDFFDSKNELDMNFFNEKEASHLQDVKNLIIESKFLYYTSTAVFWAILIAYYVLNKKQLIEFFSDGLFYGGLFTISFLAILTILYVTTGFNFLFMKFHEIFFTGNYAFDPKISNMKALFPDAFFFDMALRIILRIFIKALLLIGVGYFLTKRRGKSNVSKAMLIII